VTIDAIPQTEPPAGHEPLDGLLVVNKPTGPTSHDVVARVRRALSLPRIGHTGTLDPAADGVLVLVVGRATRLARYLSDEKEYMATVQLGIRTDSYDATGTPVGPEYAGAFPSDDAIEDALAAFRGAFLQRPPLFSAKHIGGQRGHAIGRRERRAGLSGGEATVLEPVQVTVHRLDLVAVSPPFVTLNLVVSPGFYVRSLAHDLGERLGTGAHLAALTRTRVGPFVIDHALPLTDLEVQETAAATAQASLVQMALALPRLEAVTVTAEGAIRVGRGQDIRAEHVIRTDPSQAGGPPGERRPDAAVKVLDASGRLIALAERRPGRPGQQAPQSSGTADGSSGILHPSVVLV
jgi:tRNA pseudouridine55 synthase